MTDLQELYQSIILDHNRRPKNYGPLDGATHASEGKNPLCGDEVTVQLRLSDDGARVEEARFTAQGCAVSRASASIMTEAVKGKDRATIERLFAEFHDLVTGKRVPAPDDTKRLGAMVALSGVAKYPNRVKCASMAWHTLRDALGGPAGDAPPAK